MLSGGGFSLPLQLVGLRSIRRLHRVECKGVSGVGCRRGSFEEVPGSSISGRGAGQVICIVKHDSGICANANPAPLDQHH
jgi:hypothetical protein